MKWILLLMWILFAGGAFLSVTAADSGFEVLGTAARTVELRSLTATVDDEGRRIVLARVADFGPHGGALLLWEVDRDTSSEYVVPPEVNPKLRYSYSSVLTRDRKYYYDQRGYLVCFDLRARQMRFLGRATTDEVMTYCEGPDGTIYLGTTPHCRLIAYSPATGKITDYGRMDDREAYLSHLAVDREGVVYCGIGTARAHIVAFDPATGRKTSILPEPLRAKGKGVVMPAADGTVYASFGNFRVQLLGGRVVAENGKMPAARADLVANYGGRLRTFPDGSSVVRWDFYRGIYDVREMDGRVVSRSFDFTPGGVEITSIAASPDGRKVHITTAHPMHWVIYDPATGKMTDYGLQPMMTGGNFCNFANDGKRLYACEYPFGDLWIYEPDEVPRWKSENIPHFGLWPGDLARTVRMESGSRVAAMMMPPMLFGKGDRDGAVFRMPLRVERAGRYYLNAQFLCSPLHGRVKLRFQGREAGCELQSDRELPSEVVTLGPFDLKTGEVEMEVMVSRMSDDRPPMFGLTGVELAAAPRTVKPEPAPRSNPRLAGRWGDAIARPRTVTVHPDGRHVLFSGFAGYGMTGGAIGIYDLETGEKSQIADYLPGLSCIALRTLPNGDLIGGTSVAAPGGGYRQAKEAAIFIIDWSSRKLKKSYSIPEASSVVSLELWRDRVCAMLADGRLLLLNPETLAVERTFDLKEFGEVPRCSLQRGPDGRLFILQRWGIHELTTSGESVRLLGRPPQEITAGGAVVDGWLYFSGNGINVQRFRIPPTADPAK